MTRVTIYLPDELAKRVRERAMQLRMGVSAYLRDLAVKDALQSRSSCDFDALYGSWQGTLEEPADPVLD